MSSQTLHEEDSDDEVYNPGNLPGDNVWQPDPKTIAELYEKLDKERYLELQWKCPGRMQSQDQTVSQASVEKVEETPEAELKLREKQKMLSLFDADDLDIKTNTPSALNKTPKAPRSNAKVKASFDKIFNKVSNQTQNEPDKTT